MVTKQKNIMLVFPLLDIFGCVSNLSEACSTNSKKPLFTHHCVYPMYPITKYLFKIATLSYFRPLLFNSVYTYFKL